MITLLTIAQNPNNNPLTATNGVIKYPCEAMAEVVRIMRMGLESMVNANAVGIATKRKYFREYFKYNSTFSKS